METRVTLDLNGVQTATPTPTRGPARPVATSVVPTSFGDVRVETEGDASLPALVTYHDIGLDPASCFGNLFQVPAMTILLRHFCLHHITAPGHDSSGSRDIAEYPTMGELAVQLREVLVFKGIQKFVGIGCGAGGNVMLRYAMAHAPSVKGLCLISTTASAEGWMTWGQRWLTLPARQRALTLDEETRLLTSHLGKAATEEGFDATVVMRNLIRAQNPVNVKGFMKAFDARDSVLDGVARDLADTWMLHVVGQESPLFHDHCKLNNECSNAKSSFIKMRAGNVVCDTDPAGVYKALRLFLETLYPGLSAIGVPMSAY